MKYLLSSLDNVKKAIKKTNTTDDLYLEEIVIRATSDIEEYTDRSLRGRTYGSGGLGAEYHNGDGSDSIYVQQYPIISVSSLYDDTERDFAAATLKASTDYIVWKDEGMIQLRTDAVLGTYFVTGRGNIKLIYTAGYDHFSIITGVNDTIDFNDGGSNFAATLTAGIYTAADLTSQIKTQMDAAGGQTYTITYDYYTSKFKIATDGAEIQLLVTTGTNTHKTALRTIGFTEDHTGSANYTGDIAVLGIPHSLERACIELCMRYWKDSKYGDNRFDMKSKSLTNPAGGATQYVGGKFPPHVEVILNRFKRVPLI